MSTEQHIQYSDEDFEQKFRDLSLPPKIFSHEAHLRLAWILISKYGLNVAKEKLCEQIRAFDLHHGDGSMYNETLTIAAANIVYHFMKRAENTGFLELLLQFPRLKSKFKDLIYSHYSYNIFNKQEAKKEYLKPDLLPFPHEI